MSMERTHIQTGSTTTTKDRDTIRVGQIKFTNALPICHFLDKTHSNIEFYPGAPTELNGWLADGTVDVGLISAFSYAEHADEYVALRGLSVTSRGPVGSIFLFSKLPIDELSGRVIALTTMSASSNNLLKVLLAEKGIMPQYIDHPSNLPAMMEKADAAVLIADDALHWSVHNPGYHMYDLGEEWNRMTGHSMTFAVCAVPKRILESNEDKVRQIHRMFLESKRMGLVNMNAIFARATEMVGQSEEFWRTYFGKLIYDFDEDLVIGANHYFDAAYRHGLLPKPAKVELWGDDK